MFQINQPQLTTEQQKEMRDIMRTAIANQPSGFRVLNYKITPEQIEQIEAHLSRASWWLNTEHLPDWEDLQSACREIADALESLRVIRNKVK